MDQNYVSLEHERYAANLTALAECVAHGVSDQSIQQLAYECGIDKRDLAILFNKQEAA